MFVDKKTQKVAQEQKIDSSAVYYHIFSCQHDPSKMVEWFSK